MKSLRSPFIRTILKNGCQQQHPVRRAHAPATFPSRQPFSSNAVLLDTKKPPEPVHDVPNTFKNKQKRKPVGKNSLRVTAIEAQRSRAAPVQGQDTTEVEESNNTVRAISVASQFDMEVVSQTLRSHGFSLDPDNTGFDSDQVIHTRGSNNGDIFVFPSGSLVAWSLPEDVVSTLATKTLLPAALEGHVVEVEDLEYIEDPKRDSSSIKGDVITLGTKVHAEADSTLDATLAKIAFSSGLARSTKLAVLETMLSKYLESTRSIPTTLSRGERLPFNRKFMSKKTGELLELRSQLNHYSELTDSLPDLFWDSKHNLGLEDYYDQVGRSLDCGKRIKSLNEKMDYAQETASILRQILSEKHMIDLEWIIILLIAVEVGFGIWHIYEKLNKKKLRSSETEAKA